MKRKNIVKVTFLLAVSILAGSISMRVSAASMTKSLNWSGYAVTITNSWSDPYVYYNKNILFVYSGKSKSGTLLDSKTVGPAVDPAVNVIKNSSTKSAYAKYYTLDGGAIVSKYTCTKNKGKNL